MKKLKLKLDGIKEMLTKEQMKKISGGYDPGNGPHVPDICEGNCFGGAGDCGSYCFCDTSTPVSPELSGVYYCATFV